MFENIHEFTFYHFHCLCARGNLRKHRDISRYVVQPFYQTEDDIKASGLHYLIFRNVLYMDAIPQFVGEQVFMTGIHLPVGEGKVPFALRCEMGEAIANALLQRDCQNRTYNLTGSESYSFDDIASTLTKLSGKEVQYTSTTQAAFEAQLQTRGVPTVVAQRIVGFLTDIKNGQEEEVSTDMEDLLGRKPASLEAGLKALFKLAACRKTPIGTRTSA